MAAEFLNDYAVLLRHTDQAAKASEMEALARVLRQGR